MVNFVYIHAVVGFLCKSYHDQSMAQGVRVQVVLPQAVANRLKAAATDQQRTVSNLAAYWIETALIQAHASAASSTSV
jgi:hypothetical protein